MTTEDICHLSIGDLLVYSTQFLSHGKPTHVAGIVIDKNQFGYKIDWQNKDLIFLSGETWIHHKDITSNRYIIYRCQT